MLVLQSCADSLLLQSDSSSETFPTSNDGTCDISNVKFKDNYLQWEEEVNVKSQEE
jgi:hypothetical protein